MKEKHVCWEKWMKLLLMCLGAGYLLKTCLVKWHICWKDWMDFPAAYRKTFVLLSPSVWFPVCPQTSQSLHLTNFIPGTKRANRNQIFFGLTAFKVQLFLLYMLDLQEVCTWSTTNQSAVDVTKKKQPSRYLCLFCHLVQTLLAEAKSKQLSVSKTPRGMVYNLWECSHQLILCLMTFHHHFSCISH